MGTKEELTIVSDQVETLKKILENTIENIELLKKHPDLLFTYPGLLFGREKTISSKAVAEKIDAHIVPQLTKVVALKIAERAKLEKQIKELENKKL